VDFRVIPWPTLRAKPSFLRVFVLTRRAPNPPFPFPWISASFRGPRPVSSVAKWPTSPRKFLVFLPA